MNRSWAGNGMDLNLLVVFLSIFFMDIHLPQAFFDKTCIVYVEESFHPIY